MGMGLVTVMGMAHMQPMVGRTMEVATSEGVGSRMAMVIVCGGAYAFATKRVSTTGPIIRVIKDPEL
jgi:hypothetical protein